MGSILAFIKALPALVLLLQELSKFLQQTFGEDPVKRMQELTEAFRLHNEATTTEERIDAVKRLQALTK